jgi:hypothetical protein
MELNSSSRRWLGLTQDVRSGTKIHTAVEEILIFLVSLTMAEIARKAFESACLQRFKMRIISSSWFRRLIMSQTYQYGDYNRSGMLAFAFSMAAVLLFFVYVAFIHSGVDLQEIKADDVKAGAPAIEASSESAETEPDSVE